MKIYINNEQNKIELPEDISELAEKVARSVLKEEGRNSNYEVSITFVNNDDIKELNKEYRDKDSVTDVLSFPMIDEDEIEIEGAVSLLGDIVISAEKADEQAKEFGHSLNREVVYLIVHSMFHLLNYDHIDEDDKVKMREKEKKITRELEVFKK